MKDEIKVVARSQDFRVSQLHSRGEQVDYRGDLLERWEATEKEKRESCFVCYPGDGVLWDGEEQDYATCWCCKGTGKKTERPQCTE